MRLLVTIGGCTTPWTFQGSAPFDAWLGDGQWMDEGGVRLIRVPSREHFGRFTEATLRSMAASSFRHDARTFAIDFPMADRTSESLESSFLRLLGVELNQREYQRLHDAARILDNRPVAFLVRIHSNYEDAHLQCIEFLERIEKVGGFRRPTIVGIVSHSGLPLQPSYGFLRGFPENLELVVQELGQEQVWRRYVHLRLAWETGGFLGLAEEWEQRHGFRKIPIGNDDLLENRLNFAAAEQLKAVPPDTIELLRTEISSSSDLRLRDVQNAQLFESEGLSWQGNGLHGNTLTSWAARAFLQSNAIPNHAKILSSGLRCAPLAGDLLRNCFAIEFHERALCYSSMPPDSQAKDETQRLYREFQTDQQSTVRRYYPAYCLAASLDIWHFASFGEILAQTTDRDRRERQRARRTLLNLRNALAHGHYPCWKMVDELRALQQQLS